MNETGLPAARIDTTPRHAQANRELALRPSETRDPKFPPVPTGIRVFQRQYIPSLLLVERVRCWLSDVGPNRRLKRAPKNRIRPDRVHTSTGRSSAATNTSQCRLRNLPSGVPALLRRRLDPVLLQDVGNGAATDGVPLHHRRCRVRRAQANFQQCWRRLFR